MDGAFVCVTVVAEHEAECVVSVYAYVKMGTQCR